MRHAIKLLFLIGAILVFPHPASAQYQYELTPSISVSEVYDDNVNLANSDKASDYMTTVTPNVNLDIRSQKGNLTFRYAPTIVRYRTEDQNNTVRHSGAVTLGQDIGEYLRLDLTDTFLRSEDPLTETEGGAIRRTTRKIFKRNDGRAGLQYRFGQEKALTVGYGLALLKNEDVNVDGGRTQTPSLNLTYWYDIKNGFDLNYGFTQAEFFRADDPTGADNHTGHNAGVGYTHRFTEFTNGTVSYNFTNRRFNDPTADYAVQEGSLGFSHAFARDLSLSLGGGYFLQDKAGEDGASGPSYDASLVKSFEKGSIAFGGNGGWGETYLEEERRGFTKYWSVNSNLQLQLMERLSGNAAGSFRLDKGEGDREFKGWQGSIGL
ncbi:MAG: outer membrane beta-barrel protein, partial [Pseudomonadota bacterium]